MDTTQTKTTINTQEPRCSVCIFWNKSTLKYGVCEKIKDLQGQANLRFIEPTTAQMVTVMTHKSAVCDFFAPRATKYISNRTKLMKAKRNNPLTYKNSENEISKKPLEFKGKEAFSVLNNIYKKREEINGNKAE